VPNSTNLDYVHVILEAKENHRSRCKPREQEVDADGEQEVDADGEQ
jgi:hypothetical protein